MFSFLKKFIFFFWEINYFIAIKAKIGNSKEDNVFFSIFITSLFFTFAISPLFFFFQIEKLYGFDVKIISVLLFLIYSGIQLNFLFNRKKRYLELKQNYYSASSLFLYFLTWLFILLFLGISMIYDFFDGNFYSFINFIFKNYSL